MSDTGLGIQNPLFAIGVIEGNIDPRLEGRVQVRAFGIHGTVHQIPSAELPWAPVLNGIIPPLNSWVFCLFLDGRDAQQPIVLGVIPTQMNNEINPDVTGWGVIPQAHLDLLSQGSRGVDFGQPGISRLARAEYLDQTYIPGIQATREMDVPVAGLEETWDEPGASYAAKYPYNKVIETAAGHSVEIDDTPGEERIMVYHRSGSYLQIDSRGTKTDKSVSDKYDLTDGNFHIFVGGSAKVTIQQDAHLLVGGNMFQEVMGDMSLSVHGNMDLATGGQLNIYSGDQVQISGSRLAFSSKVADVNILSASDVKISGTTMNLKSSGPARLDASGLLSLKAGGNIAADGAEFRALEGAAESASEATGAATPPPISGSSFNNSIRYSSIGTTNAFSVDDVEAYIDESTIETMTESPELLAFIKQYEKLSLKAYYDYKQYSIGYGTKANSPNEVITAEEAERRLSEDVAYRRAYVSRYSTSRGRNWSPEQIDALTSFIYNGGEGWLDQVTAGNTRTDNEIATMMLEYNKADGKTMSGLVKRRQAESAWFRRGMANQGVSV